MKQILSIFFVLALIIFLAGCGSTTPNTPAADSSTAAPGTSWQPAAAPLLTQWAKEVSPGNAHTQYPRPQMVRESWLNLNGIWDYAILPKEQQEVSTFDGHILVPFAVESALSGVRKTVGENNRLWYRRIFEVDPSWIDKRILLHFGAVDWETSVWLNGRLIGNHRGGYTPFSFDITHALRQAGKQEIVVSVWDPVDSGTQPRGKQVRQPRSIWYTSVTGIWQTVWLEPVNNIYIASLKIIPDLDQKTVHLETTCSIDKTAAAAGFKIAARVLADGQEVGSATAGVGTVLTLSIDNPRTWSPASPFLYDLQLTLLDGDGDMVDTIFSYFGMRKISLGKDAHGAHGITRMMLNNEFVFQFGPLDQGWWPDGLYTAPTDEALKYDIETTKKLGFNMARKHVKMEPDRWYYWCDRLGLLVWQDMPSGDKSIEAEEADITRSTVSAGQYEYELGRMIDSLGNHPCIVVWVPFNEGWGQFDTRRIVQSIKKQDPSRLVINASGWADRGVGDIHDIHAYPGPDAPAVEENRAIVLGEFGGLGLPIEGHTWQAKDNWGYRNFENAELLLAAYAGLIEKLLPLKTAGLSAAVYTQTSDVEIEVNGLMTYDRAIIKMEPVRLAGINSALYNKPDKK